MFRTISRELRRHRRSGSSRAAIAVIVYRFGRFTLGIRPAPLRYPFSLAYLTLSFASEIVSGVFLDRTTEVGQDLHLIHAGHINIHPDARLGDRVGIMHGVTLGTGTTGGAPTVGNDVLIGCNASVLGGVTIGHGARIAANTLVLCDVPPGATAIGVPAQIIPALPIRARSDTACEPPSRPLDAAAN